jgi:probable phosphoglycerate mutase
MYLPSIDSSAMQIMPSCAPSQAEATVILIRHGQSTYNAEGRYQGNSDEAVLTKTGYTTAYQTGLYLRSVAPNALYTSPLQRAQQTTNAILQGMGHDKPIALFAQIHPDLQEAILPAWEGLTFEFVQEQFAEAYRCWKERPHEFLMDLNAIADRSSSTTLAQSLHSPVQELYDRAQRFWQEVLPRHAGQTVLVVSHSGTIRALISTALGMSGDRYHTLQQSNCGISILQFSDSTLSSAQLVALNLTAHLDETLPKLKEGKEGLRLLCVPSESADHSHTAALAELLHHTEIQFSLSEDTPEAQQTSEHLLHHHPHTVQLHVSQTDWCQSWQDAIAAQSNLASPLMTGLVVAHPLILQSMLGRAIGLPPNQHWRLPLQRSLSVLHYPSHYSPVLQVLNYRDEPIRKFLELATNPS